MSTQWQAVAVAVAGSSSSASLEVLHHAFHAVHVDLQLRHLPHCPVHDACGGSSRTGSTTITQGSTDNTHVVQPTLTELFQDLWVATHKGAMQRSKGSSSRSLQLYLEDWPSRQTTTRRLITNRRALSRQHTCEVECAGDGEASQARVGWQQHRDRQRSGKHNDCAHHLQPHTQPAVDDLDGPVRAVAAVQHVTVLVLLRGE